MGGLLQLAKNDIKRITTDLAEWPVVIQFTTPTGIMFNVTGLHTKHHLGINGETGQRVNTKNASVTISESSFTDIGVSVRDAQGEVDMDKYLVSVADSSGKVCAYQVTQWFPDETVGLIVMILSDLE